MKNSTTHVGRPKAGERDVYSTIIDTTKRLVTETETPLKGITTSSISTNAGVSRSLIRYYFGSKDALMETVIEELVSAFFNKLSDVISGVSHQYLIDDIGAYSLME